MKTFRAVIWILLIFDTRVELNELNVHKLIFSGNYSKDARPKRNATEALSVYLNLVIYSIHDVDEKYQSISIRTILDIQWKDEFLTWNPDDFGGVKSITVPGDKIWVPDIVMQDTFVSIFNSIEKNGRAILNYDGHVTIWPGGLFQVACKISVKKFPFDKQTCPLDFLSWTRPSTSIRLINSNTEWRPHDHSILEKGEWSLENVRIINQTKIFECVKWDHVLFLIDVKRKPLFHVVNVIIPVMLISILDVMCFVLPSESGERVGLSISIFLTLTVFLSAVTSTLPESSDELAVFTLFLGLQVLGSALSVIMTNISLFLYFKDKQETLSLMAMYLVKLFFMENKCRNVTWHTVSRALDRLCLVFAAIWHTVLISSFLIAVYQ
ncbi:neuronal acetylcholine receptor subunit alpha-7-like [Ruditapes philippinarum]|uniref:neuronal acetylcholine receptor subunit alpha-7-like n=1 Tax=Ruditapes philippinarum TaxID=129788 RepID=UPI00295A96BC|nr:neuronal acetylcholine receptor subunit alpha-7-like [Ruditapes philippinarum]